MSSAQARLNIERFDLHYDPVEKEPFAHPSPTGEFVRYSDVASLSALEPGEAEKWEAHSKSSTEWAGFDADEVDRLKSAGWRLVPAAIAHIDHGKTSLTATLARGAIPVPTPDGAVEAIEKLRRQLADAHPNHKTMFVYVDDLRAALETTWQKPGRAAQAQAGEKPDFPADEQSGETSHVALSHPADGWRLVPAELTDRLKTALDEGWYEDHPGWNEIRALLAVPATQEADNG